MELLTKLLAIEAPENTTLTSAELTFRGLMPWWLAAFVFLALIVGVVTLYMRERGTLGWPRRILLIGLRIALVAILLVLLFRPVLLAEFEGERPRGVALLVDNSGSMKQQDRRLNEMDRWRVALANNLVPHGSTPGGTPPLGTPKDPARADLVRAVLNHSDLKLVERLEKFGPLRPLLFGTDLHGTPDDGSKETVARLLAGFKAEESQTRLADAIVKVMQSKDADPPTAVVVITDGLDNASKFTLQEAALECARLNVPLHVYGVGTAEGGSLQLKEVGAPETMFVEDAIAVPLRWRAQGFKKGTVEITLKLGDKEVARKDVPVQAGDDLRETLGFVVPKGKEADETMNLVASLRYKDEAGFKDSLTRTVRVVDRKIRILYVENSPRWEYKFLQPALLRDRRVQADFLLVNADPKVATSVVLYLPEFPPTREKFFDAKYNLIILGDVAAAYLGKEHLEWIREFVQERGGLIVLAGRQNMPGSYENTPLAEVLPIEFGAYKAGLDSDVRTQEYPPTLTEAGLRSDMLALADTPEESQEIWQKKLPGFHWQFPIMKLRPAAVPLLVNPRAKMGEQAMPLLASHHYGKGEVLFMGTDETRRWRWNYQDKYFVRFWGQLIYQLGLPSMLGDSAKRVQVALEHSKAVLGEPSSVFVRLLDKDFNPRTDARVEATLEHLDARPGQERVRKVTLLAVPGQPGEYRAQLANDRPGRFDLKISNPDVNTWSYRVELRPGHELEEAGLAEQALRDLAVHSGGQFYREEDLARLADQIEPRSASFTRRQEILLWNPLILVLFVGLITVEWLVRKFSDLS